MRRNIIIFVLVILIPLLIGLWTGYRIGHRSSIQPAIEPTDVEEPAVPKEINHDFQQPIVYQNATRDSITQEIATHRHNAITRAVATASPAVVGITVTEVREYHYRDPFSQFFGEDPFFRQFFGDRVLRQPVKGLGSGFIISSDGYILTNDHVAGNAQEITVTLTSGEQYKAELIGTDLVSDIALLKINGKNLPYLKLGNSDDVIIGEWVIALGNPFGLFEISDKPTVTVGVVSATGMNLQVQGGRYYRGMIQTDASINSGNSGGPLINAVGEVNGVNAVIFTPNQGSVGVGFAIPINRVKSIIAELKKSGKIERNFWTGLEINTVDARVARYFGLDKAEGVIVSDVKRGSPAQRSGFKVGDIITEVNGERVVNEDNIAAIVNDAKAGDVLRMKVLREKREIMLELRLERRPS
ncbi:MAG: trypsin-like peptidase domain-containing protein [Ignavibacteriae bacterium]|nr:trypsin-like peptidase domain-containing protein [Ignavibacteriota bacterium]